MRTINVPRWLFSPLTGALFLGLVTGAVLFSGYRYQLNNDGMSYLLMARHYAAGDLGAAINTYWAPMYAWLIALLLGIGIDELTAAKLVTLASALSCVPILWSFRTLFPASTSAWWTGMCTLTVLMVLWAADLTTPDVLLCVWYLLFIRISLAESMRRQWLQGGVLLGIIAGFGYFTKAVSLPFFFLLSIGIILLRRVDDGRWFGGKQMIVAIVTALVVSAPWIAVLSAEKGAFTIGENAGFIHAYMNPLESQNIPMMQGLIQPSGASALSIWDDPTAYGINDWHALDSVSHFIKQIHIVILNAELFATLVLGPLLLFWVILCAAAVFSFSSKTLTRPLAQILFLSTILFLGLYLPFIIEYRYFWPVMLLAGVYGIHFLSRLEGEVSLPLARIVAHALFILSFLALPLWNAAVRYDNGERIHAAAVLFKKETELTAKNLASDNWKQGLQFGYHTRARYFGQAKHKADSLALEEELLATDIDAYVAFSSPPTLRAYRRIEIPGIRTPVLYVRD